MKVFRLHSKSPISRMSQIMGFLFSLGFLSVAAHEGSQTLEDIWLYLFLLNTKLYKSDSLPIFFSILWVLLLEIGVSLCSSVGWVSLPPKTSFYHTPLLSRTAKLKVMHKYLTWKIIACMAWGKKRIICFQNLESRLKHFGHFLMSFPGWIPFNDPFAFTKW